MKLKLALSQVNFKTGPSGIWVNGLGRCGEAANLVKWQPKDRVKTFCVHAAAVAPILVAVTFFVASRIALTIEWMFPPSPSQTYAGNRTYGMLTANPWGVLQGHSLLLPGLVQ